MNIEAFLSTHGISFQRFDHPAVFTCEEAMRLLPSDIPGAHTKNLFLRDKKGSRHFLVVVGYEKQVHLKELAHQIGVQSLSFASPERLQKHLGVTPGSVTLLGLIHDAGHAVEVYMDAALWQAPALLCHPLVNTATLAISHEGIEKFLTVTGHEPRVVGVP